MRDEMRLITDALGNPAEIVGYWIDITERKRAEQELHESEERYRSLVDAAPDVIYTVSAEDGSLTSLNPAFETLTGWSRAEWLGKSIVGIVHPDDLPVAVETFQKASRGETQPPYELRVLSKSGEYLVGEFISTPHVKDGKVVGELGIARDITERKRAEEALRASEERFRSIVETAEEGIWMIDAESRTTFANKKMAEMLGCTQEEMMGRSLFDFMDEEGRALAKLLVERRRRGIREQHDFKFRRQDGATLWALLAASPVFDEAGRYMGALAMVTDITQRKQLQEQFRQVQKMEAVGRLAGGIAHDFNNLLTVIMGFGQLLYEKLAAGDPLRAYADTINKAGDRAAGLTRELLAFSRQQVLAPQVLDLNSVVANVDTMLRRLIGEDIDLVIRRGHGLGQVKADPGQIEQVIMNLAVNARDAMPQGGKLTIKTANVTLDEAYARSHYPLKPGPYVMLAVSDTGCGMDEETRTHIFEPFFTTKAKGMGTGLGLATVYGIVKQSGGYIWVESEEGRGTTFTMYLPRIEESVGAVEEKTAAAPARGTETVLLVEDEGEVRALIRRVLEAGGYTVLEASHGEEALRISEQHQGPIHLLLTDVVMPGMSGRELTERLTPLRRETKVLYTSGYTDDAILQRSALDPEAAFLQKPFTPDAVVRRVREVLGE
jgi:PAS domain S-box-containing protein